MSAHSRMPRLASSVLSLLLMSPPLLAQSATQPKSSKPTATPTAFDQATLVILTSGGPVLADLRISVAKIPYRTWVGKFLAQQMDMNKDGLLSKSELNLLTDNVRRLAGIEGDVLTALQSSASAGAAMSSEGTISLSKFSEWLHDRLPRAFDLIAQPQPADDAVRLAMLIDSDADGVVTATEFAATFQTLRFRDLDNDQTLSVAELVPYRDPRSQQAALTPDAASLPFFHVTDADSARLAAERIVRRYGDGTEVGIDVLRLPAGSSISSQSGDRVSVSQLATWLVTPSCHLTIDVKLSDRSNTSDIDVAVSSEAASWCKVVDDSFGQTALKLDGVPIRIFARGGGSNTRKVTRGYLGQTFVMADADRSQSLDESEFPGVVSALQQSGANGSFADVDLDKDLQVTRDELFSFAERDQMAAASRIEVSVKQDGKSLFSEIDRNKDRRLALREIRSAKEVLSQFDMNGDGSFAETELGTEYSLTFGLGQPEIRRVLAMSSMNMMEMNSNAVLPGREGLSGPEWFRRMDRNQDGDVSPREFLGRSDQFRQIDADSDGLISSSEAEAVKKSAE